VSTIPGPIVVTRTPDPSSLGECDVDAPERVERSPHERRL
jgi:hypothetical protein